MKRKNGWQRRKNARKALTFSSKNTHRKMHRISSVIEVRGDIEKEGENVYEGHRRIIRHFKSWL